MGKEDKACSWREELANVAGMQRHSSIFLNPFQSNSKVFQTEKIRERQDTAHRSVLPTSPVFHTFARRPCRKIKLRASSATPTRWLRGGEKGNPSSCTQPLQLGDPSGCGKSAHQPLMVAEGRMKSCKSGVAEPCDRCQAGDAKCVCRDGSPMETKGAVLAHSLCLFSVAVCPRASGWLAPCCGFPIHETRANLLFRSTESARDQDGWVGWASSAGSARVSTLTREMPG